MVPVNPAVFFFQESDVGSFFVILRGVRCFAFLDEVKGCGEGVGGKVGEAVVEFSGGFVGVDGKFLAGKDVSGIESFIHPDDGDAGFWVAVFYGCLDAGSTTVFR